jgi:hypothetical protein
MKTRTSKDPKDLVVFNYNGETWDAHEVLGVARGDSLKSIEASYSQRVQEMGDKAGSFLKAAYDAIVKSKSAK